jgi:hypothetical protein
MSRIFTKQWSDELANLWNKDKEMVSDLSAIGFRANIGFGMIHEVLPRILFAVNDGKVEVVTTETDTELDWDLRASEEHWQDWAKGGFGLHKLGVATTNGELRFLAGDYRRMIRNQQMAGPFLRLFDLMTKLKSD